MPTVREVREVAADLDEAIEVTMDTAGTITVRGRGVVETYDTAEEAIAGLRASWAPQPRVRVPS